MADTEPKGDDPQSPQQQHLQQQQQQQQPSPPEDVTEKVHVERDQENEDTLLTPTLNGISYPPADKPIDRLSMSERMMKIGRSCPCDGPTSTETGEGDESTSENNCDCQGWKPKPAGTLGRVDICACGHKLSLHGGPWTGEEFERRLRAAFRRDELLQVREDLL